MTPKEILTSFFWLILFCIICLWIGYGIGTRQQNNRTQRDTVTLTDILFLPMPVPGKYIIVEVPADVDTAAILKDYYTQKIYDDTLVHNNRMNLVLRDTVYNNKLLGRTVNYTLSNPVPKNESHELMISGDVGFKHQSIMLDYKLDRFHFRAGYDFYNKAPMAGVGFTLIKW